jgi:HK97 gp10 family phage protein
MVTVSPAFRRRLQNVVPQVSAAVRPILIKSADELVALMKRLCPVEDGDLRDSIGWAWGDAPRGAVVIDKLSGRGRGRDRIVIYAGNATAYYARWVEFGTRKSKAHPFFFPAYRALKRRIRSRISRATRKALREIGSG